MRFFIVGLVGLVLVSAPAMADPPPDPGSVDQKVDAMIQTSRQVYGVEQPQRGCKPAAPGEIVVCVDRGRPQRVESTADGDPNSLAARRFRNGGMPTPPQLDHGYCPSCPHFGWVPPPAYYVDVGSLPQAPEGSDADRISKGDAPAP